jgi:16S rRNA (cytosine967-C5)-methyltransferase
VSTRGATASIAPARRAAHAVVRRVFEHGAYADRALHAAARDLDGRDRALSMRLAFGTVQRRATLDHLIAALTERPVQRLDPPVRAALRLGLYELLYTSGAPPRAIVADAVELTKAAGGGRGGPGLVNAVLRRAAEQRHTLLAPLDDDTPRHAAVRHSIPEWVAELWFSELGADPARALMAAANEPAESVLRANTLVLGADELQRRLPVGSRRDPGLPEALVLESAFDAHGSALWREGAFTPQSRASMLPARVVAPRAGERVLDLCAAPGAKTTHLAALMGGAGEVVAVERHAGRAQALARTAGRMHAGCVRVEVADATSAAPPPRTGDAAGYDAVLVDPPCSGLGTLAARPDLRWRVDAAAVQEMARQQAAILRAGADALRPGGRLVYSTCTISPAENERLISEFLDGNCDFSAEDVGAEWPAYRHPHDPRHLLTLPHRDGTAGFFVARLRRRG